jgi:acetylornithine deacetylase/succinyl-diaminopimelate desuccinylase-like protein
VQAAEKTYQSFRLETRDKGGHSSIPRQENPIYRLAAALLRIQKVEFQVHLNPVTREYFRRAAPLQSGARAAYYAAVAQDPPDPAAVRRLAADPVDNALLRTTCVATELSGGHAENALPQLAAAVVNCRLVPGDFPDEVRAALQRAIGDPRISIAPIEKAVASPASDVPPGRMRIIEDAVEAQWPGVPVITQMQTGATDGKFLRIAGIPVYGVSALFGDVEDVRAHGRDERISVQSFREGLAFDYRLIRAIGGGPTAR